MTSHAIKFSIISQRVRRKCEFILPCMDEGICNYQDPKIALYSEICLLEG